MNNKRVSAIAGAVLGVVGAVMIEVGRHRIAELFGVVLVLGGFGTSLAGVMLLQRTFGTGREATADLERRRVKQVVEFPDRRLPPKQR